MSPGMKARSGEQEFKDIKVTYHHPLIMEKAINTISRFGFLLKDTNKQLVLQWIDELMRNSKQGHSLGSENMQGRCHKNAILGEGYQTFTSIL